MGLIFVDCEAWGGAPSVGQLTEFGAVDYDTWHDKKQWSFYHGIIVPAKPDPRNPAVSLKPRIKPTFDKEHDVAQGFADWLKKKGRPVFVSDNPAYDWQWINDLFWRTLDFNPFGHSARRISDFYAGLVGDWFKATKWKRLRVTKHDHNPVHDSMGNVEAFERIMSGER